MFQSTHPHGVRLSDTENSYIRLLFQSTHPHGVRLRRVPLQYGIGMGFNPRTRTGCDALRQL